MLAGGLGRRMGGGKSTAVLGGRPLLQRPIDAMRQAGLTVAVVAKPDTPLPIASPTPAPSRPTWVSCGGVSPRPRATTREP